MIERAYLRAASAFDKYKSYGDLKNAFGTNYPAALDHWASQGLPNEGRAGGHLCRRARQECRLRRTTQSQGDEAHIYATRKTDLMPFPEAVDGK
jgi:hypothetical protein